MEVQSDQTAPDAPLHLIESVRAKAQEICIAEGATLNEFVNVAVAEKLAHYAHMEWLKRRKPVTEESLAEALRILRRAGSEPPDPGDELPEGFQLPK
jgi:hypothetical protein